MIKTATFHLLICDVCGERMENGDYGSYVVADGLDEARQLIGDNEWRQEPDGRLECMSCFEERDLAARVHECPTCGAPPSKPCNAPREGIPAVYCCATRVDLEPPKYAPLNGEMRQKEQSDA